MDTISITGAALMMKAAQTQLAMTTSLMKMAAEQQNQVANVLAQISQSAPQPMNDTLFNFSTYA